MGRRKQGWVGGYGGNQGVEGRANPEEVCTKVHMEAYCLILQLEK